jgi:hypothetical protein
VTEHRSEHTFQSFWWGKELSPYEVLCLKSFVAHGYKFLHTSLPLSALVLLDPPPVAQIERCVISNLAAMRLRHAD